MVMVGRSLAIVFLLGIPAFCVAPRNARNVSAGFEENRGQYPSSIRYLARRGRYSIGLKTDGVSLFAASDEISLTFSGGNRQSKLIASEPLRTVVNHFPNDSHLAWHTGVPTFNKVVHSSIYPGVDLVFYQRREDIEFDFILSPGAAPKSIQIHVDGARKISVDADGSLCLSLPGSDEIRLKRPVVYQESAAHRSTISASYVTRGKEVASTSGGLTGHGR